MNSTIPQTLIDIVNKLNYKYSVEEPTKLSNLLLSYIKDNSFPLPTLYYRIYCISCGYKKIYSTSSLPSEWFLPLFGVHPNRCKKIVDNTLPPPFLCPKCKKDLHKRIEKVETKTFTLQQLYDFMLEQGVQPNWQEL